MTVRVDAVRGGTGRHLAAAASGLALALALTAGAAQAADADMAEEKVVGTPAADPYRLSDKPVPMITEEALGGRTAPILEIGDPFLSTGRLSEPLVLPTGAVWNPSLWVYGTLRSAVSVQDDQASDTRAELSTRLDLIANLQLSGTERVVLGLTPLHDGTRYSTYTFAPDRDEGWDSPPGIGVSTLFLEAELAELFPNLDPTDSLPLDIGVAVGRQFIDLQDGMLVNDTIDSVGLVKNNIMLPDVTNLRVTGLFGWGQIHRNDNRRDEDAHLWAVSTAWDTFDSTFEADAAYVEAPEDRTSQGDSIHLGFGAIQRMGAFNTTFRALYSNSLETDSGGADDGVLLFAETSMEPPGPGAILYANGFAALGDYTSAARAPGTGGALGRVGLAFASPQLGSVKPALSNRTSDVVGGAVGYQMFLDGPFTQLTFEAAGRLDTAGEDTSGAAVSARFQQRLTKRVLWQVDGYVAGYEDARDIGAGARSEIRVQF